MKIREAANKQQVHFHQLKYGDVCKWGPQLLMRVGDSVDGHRAVDLKSGSLIPMYAKSEVVTVEAEMVFILPIPRKYKTVTE